MNCGSCGFEVQSGFAFCPKCGTRQPIVCTSCSYPCAPDFAFCPKCGAEVAGAPKPIARPAAPPPAPAVAAGPAKSSVVAGDESGRTLQPAGPETEADRRTVTVLFADLSGFTSLSEQLDPELMRTLQNELFAELTAAVQRFGGFVDKFIGDALLALFGAPVAHEDDPERALRAALDMMARTTDLGERSNAVAGQPLMLHIGVHTGPVVTGGFGVGNAKSYSVTGDTVNTAQRLQSMAAPGEILVGPLTHRLTRHAFAYELLGDVALRGKAGSVLVHRLAGHLETPRAARGLEALGLNAPLIGRDSELTRLLDSLDLACGGSAQLVRLVGEAGIGKSRLVNEFIARLGDEDRFADVAVRRTACSPLGEQSYGAIAAVVRSAAGMMLGDPPDEMRAKLASLLRGLGIDGDEAIRLMPLLFHVLGLGDPDAALRHVAPEQLRRQILYAVRTIIDRRLSMSPLLIIVEDLHWADAVSLEALRFVMDRLERTRLMLVVTHRPALDNDALNSSRVSHTTLRLSPLGANDGQKLLAALFGERWSRSSGNLGDRILDRAGGNPLFVEEIVRGLIEVGVIKRDGQQWLIESDNAATDIPAGIQAMLLARVDRLPQEVRRLAQEAAVIGPRFDASLLRAVVPDPARLDADLELLCDAEIIEEVAGSAASSQAYRFTQTILQDVIYQNLLLQRRTEMHGRIGAAFERICGNSPERLEDLILLGHHLSLSAARERGARYLRAAGDRARMIHANDDALRFYQQAFACLAAVEQTPLRLQLGERIADLCGPAGRRETCAWALRNGPAGISRGRRSHRLGADPPQDRPPALGRRQARQRRGALCRSRSSARGCRCADRAGASVAGTRAAGVSNRRQCPGRKMGGRSARVRALPASGARC